MEAQLCDLMQEIAWHFLYYSLSFEYKIIWNDLEHALFRVMVSSLFCNGINKMYNSVSTLTFLVNRVKIYKIMISIVCIVLNYGRVYKSLILVWITWHQQTLYKAIKLTTEMFITEFIGKWFLKTEACCKSKRIISCHKFNPDSFSIAYYIILQTPHAE